MIKNEVDRPPIIGEFNTNYFVNDNGRDMLLRVPRKNLDLFQNIIHEYRTIGFTGSGGRVVRRSVGEQFEFSRKAAESGLLVLPPLALDGETIIYPYLHSAQTLDQYFHSIGSNVNAVVFQIVQDLKNAHFKGYIYGDRWSGNMLIDPRFGLIHIDFDLSISGPFARELDVAQVIYHTLWSNNRQVLPILATLLTKEQRWFDSNIVIRYLRGLARYFSHTKVGGLEETTEQFIKIMQA